MAERALCLRQLADSPTHVRTISKPQSVESTLRNGNMQYSSKSEEFWSGVKQELPLIVGVAPFGLVYGVLGIASGLTELQTILLSSILFAGASQVVFVQLLANGVPSPDRWNVGFCREPQALFVQRICGKLSEAPTDEMASPVGLFAHG